MVVQYVVYPELELVEFHAHAGAYVVGMPQPTALAGLAHACARQLTAGSMSGLNQCLYAVSAATLGGVSRHMVNDKEAPNAKRSMPGPLVERVRSTMRISLVISLEHGVPITPEQADLVIERQRCMGASIFVRRAPSVVPSLADALRLFPATHFVVTDASAQVAELAGEGMRTPDAIASLIARPVRDVYKPRWVPVLSGYRLLQQPRPKIGQRDGAASHAYAEPVLGVALLRNRFSAMHALRNDPEAPLMWRHTRQGDLCVLKGAAQITSFNTDDF